MHSETSLDVSASKSKYLHLSDDSPQRQKNSKGKNDINMINRVNNTIVKKKDDWWKLHLTCLSKHL